MTGHIPVFPLTSPMLCRYKETLVAASTSLQDHLGNTSGVLLLNLGPLWGNSDAYDLFNSNVFEIQFKDWESPPGLGIAPLDVVFQVCLSMSSWLSLNEDHHVVRIQTGLQISGGGGINILFLLSALPQ